MWDLVQVTTFWACHFFFKEQWNQGSKPSRTLVAEREHIYFPTYKM